MRTIIYDLDNTLYDRSVPFIRAFNRFFRDRYDAATAKAAYISCNTCSNEVFADSQTGKITMEAMYIYRYCEGLKRVGIGIKADDALTIQRLYKEAQGHLEMTPAMGSILDMSAARFDVVAILTNGPGPHQRAKAAGIHVERWVPDERIFISGEMGVMKPDAAAYRYVANALRLIPEETWMVGDSYSNDIAGALAEGWHGIWFNHLKDPLPAGALAPDHTVETEKALAEVIAAI